MIEKNSPKKFVADKDERLLKIGEMIEAQNITITERGEGTGSIVKTFKGVDTASPASGETDLNTEVKVIGSVEDSQRDFIYFFVATVTGNSSDMILQYNPSDNTYKEVYKDDWLNFSSDGFVKGDVINKDFQRDGGLQTILYFTDNVNPPRKINVDRALAGDYDNVGIDSNKDIAFGAMRAAPTKPPTFYFASTSTRKGNNFLRESFQFATQIIYIDGEESALSPYSKLAVSPDAHFSGLERGGFGSYLNYGFNYCRVKHNISYTHPDMEKVRLLARSGNDGAWFVVDEFVPDTRKTTIQADGSGESTVYDPVDGEYYFYNESLGQPVPDATVNKLYDNVPLKAEGQSITGSRLMYSNYTEGYANYSLNPIDYSITPVYNSDGIAGTTFATGSTDAAAMFSTSSMDILIDLDNEPGGNIDNTTFFPAGTEYDFQIRFEPEFTARAAFSGQNLLKLDVVGQNPGSVPLHLYAGTQDGNTNMVFPAPNENYNIDFEGVTPSGFTGSVALADYLQDQTDDLELALTYDLTNVTFKAFTQDATPVAKADVVFSALKLRVRWKFGETASSTNDQVVLKPRIIAIEVVEAPTVSDAGDYATIAGFDLNQNVGDFTFTNQNRVNFSSITNDITGARNVLIRTLGVTPTFKAGATHAFGVVFYDKYGRSGFVNELGSVYVQNANERSTEGAGPVSMEFDFSDLDITAQLPPWADSYQIVYAGSSVQDTFQYTVGGAFVKHLTTDDGTNHNIDTNTHHIYVSLKTLDQYRSDKSNSLKNYSYTEGDKLRIISRGNAADTAFEFPDSSNGQTMEFDIVGIETFNTSSTNPIRKQVATQSNAEQNPHAGTFLVLSAPRVEARANESSPHRYVGFDWYHITDENYPGGTNPTQSNQWNRNVLVEIITPRKATSERVYYEIGERKQIRSYGRDGVISSNMGPAFTVSSGDVYYRPVDAKAPTRQGSPAAWRTFNYNENPEEWEYRFRYVEDPSFSDFFASRHWDKGRAHSVFKDAAQVKRYNGITYSDAYADDTSVLTLSSFNPSLANFFDLPSEYGACRYIGNMADRLVAVQEQKATLVGVNKGVIETGSQSGLVSLSTQVLNNISPFGGDYGTLHPESVLIRNGAVFFADSSRRAFVRASTQGLQVISDVDIQSFVETQFKNWSTASGDRIVSGYDPDDGVYYVTLEPKGSFNGITLGYNLGGFWQGTYTFLPTCYANINQDFLVCEYRNNGSDDDLIHRFSSDSSNLFPDGSRALSKVTVVSNYNPSMVKQYNSISLEADSAWTTTLESSTGQTTASLSFTEKEDAFYANVSGDTSSNSKNQYLAVGTVKTALTASSDPIELKNKINGFSIPRGYNLYKNDGANGFTSLSATVSSVDYSGKTVTPSDPVTVAVDDRIFVAASTQLTGDQIRGHYCKVKCEITPGGTSKEELYSINSNFVNSKANHALSQE